MGSHRIPASRATRRHRLAVGAIVVVALAGIWTATTGTSDVSPPAADTPTATALHLAELYHPAKDTSEVVDTPAATAFLASLRQAGVKLPADREDAAIDLAKQAAAVHASGADLVTAVHVLFPEFTAPQAQLFVTGIGVYFSVERRTR